MIWNGKELNNAGDITDTALDVAENHRRLAPIFLAQYTLYLALCGHSDPVRVAINNLSYMAGQYSSESAETVRRVYGTIHLVKEYV